MTAHSPAQAAPAPRLGFIGWGPGNETVWRTVAASQPEQAREARVFLPAHSRPAPAALGAVASVERLLGERELVFVDTDRESLRGLLPMMRLAVSDRNVLVLTGPGLPLSEVTRHLHERKLVRCLPLAFGGAEETVVAFYATPWLHGAEREALRRLLGAAGHLLEVEDEAQFEVARGLADMAPAVFYTMADAMADGALMSGLPRQDALPFIAAILTGAARTLWHGGQHPALLRERALEAEGAAAGLMEFESAGLRGLMMRVVEKTIRRLRPAGEPPREP